MGGSTEQTGSGAYNGNNGQRIFEATHTDIDQSTFDVSCRSGSCEVTLHEAIWYTWVRRVQRLLNSGGRINESIEVDSDWYDADHRLTIIATSDNTSVDVTWNSVDR